MINWFMHTLRPIETAPKDGRDILVYDKGFYVTWWDDDQWMSYSKHLDPTHWVALPKPPEGA